MTDYVDMLDKVEEACALLLAALIAGTELPAQSETPAVLSGLILFKGHSAEDLTESRVELVAEESEEEDETGNQNVTLKARVITNAEASKGAYANIRALHKARAAALGDSLHRSDLASKMTTYAATGSVGLTVQAATGYKQVRRTEGMNLVTEFQVTLMCMGA